MRRAKIFILLLATALLIAGCGKNRDINDNEATANIEQAADSGNSKAKSAGQVTGPKFNNNSKDTDKDSSEDGNNTNSSATILPRFDIVSETMSLEDYDGIYIVGYMNVDYLKPTDETAKEYPKLCESLEVLNEVVREECEGELPEFTDKACDYYAEQLELNPDEEYFDGLMYNYGLYVMRADDKYVSFYSKGNFFFAENDTSEYYYCYNFDSQTGELLDVTDIITDAEKFNDAVKKCYKDKYGEKLDIDVFDSDNPEAFDWCLTPVGINVYFYNEGATSLTDRSMYVCLDFDTYSDIINQKYKSNCYDYVYPFDEYDEISVDIDGDGKANSISFVPVCAEGYEETNDFEGYTVLVDGKVYDDFDETWFFDVYPYYVHNSEGNYIFAQRDGYEGSWVDIISLSDGKPEYVKSVSAEKLDGLCEVDEILYSQYRRSAFTNSSILLDFEFSDLISGAYIVVGEDTNGNYDSDEYDSDDEDDEEYEDDEYEGDEDYGEGSEQTSFEFFEVDGRYYVEHLGAFNYGASEIELMDPKPKKEGEDYIFAVRFHYFSGFSFVGDYHGGGYLCDITVHSDGSINISKDNPFTDGGEVDLTPLYDAGIHSGIQENAEWNTTCFGVEGSWRYQGMTENDEIYEYYLELHDDGTAYYAVKNDTYPINLCVGIFSAVEDDNEDEYMISFDGETMGYANMPCDTVTFIYNSEDDTLKPGEPMYEVGGDEIEYWRTKPGDWGYTFGAGPASRTDELLKDWNEYNTY